MEEQNKDMIPEGQTQEEPIQQEQPIQQDQPIQQEQPIQQDQPTQQDQPIAGNEIYTTPDVYQTQTAQDVYKTSDTDEEYQNMLGVFSGGQPENTVEESAPQFNNGVYDNNQYQYGNNQAGMNQYQTGNNQYQMGNTYQYGNNPDGMNQYQTGNNQYQTGDIYQYGNNQDGMNQYQTGNTYQYGNNPDGMNQYQTGNNQYQTGDTYQYGNNQAGMNQYQAGNQYQYGNNQYQTGNQYQYGNNQAGNQYQYGYNPYSPYAAPQKKKNTGVIIGVVIAIAVIFMIALLAIVYNAFKSISDGMSVNSNNYRAGSVIGGADDDADDDRRSSGDRGSRSDDNDYNSGYDDDDYNSDYDDDEYYTFHDDIKDNLSYSIEWDYFEYELDDEDVAIYVDYPVIVGEDVPNIDKLNAYIKREASSFKDYYEDEYSKYMDEDGNSYFYVNSTGYVTYMSESVLSIVFQEETQSNFYGAVYLYCINIDMNTGVIMKNTDIIEVDDDFSIDFRTRSERQNGVSDELDSFSDQEITKYLKSEDNLIVFYTPQGMEIGINYGDGYGWITVTYSDYKKYLKVF